MDTAEHKADWPSGTGGMAALIRAHDWAATPLGPPEGWPAGLRAVVEVMLAMPQIASVAVGPGRVLLYNDLAARQYGPRHPRVLGRPIAEGFADQYALIAGFYDRAFAGEGVHVAAQPVDSAGTGTPEVYDATLAPVRGDDGQVVAAFATFVAAGDRVRAEAALREREALFRTLADVGPQLVWSGEGPGTDFYNRRWHDYTGLDEAASLRPDAWHGVVHPDDLPLALERSERSRLTGEPYEVEYRLRRHDGAWRWHVARAFRAPGGRRWVGAVADVHDARTALDALRASEARQAFLLRLADALRPLSDPRAAMAAACRLLGEALGADRVNYAEVEGEDYVVAQEHRREGLASMAGRYPIASFRPAERQAFEAGRTVALADIEAEPDMPPEQARAYAALDARAFVSVPLVKEERLVAVLGVIRSRPGGWTPAEIALIEEAAERTWAAVERARAEAGLRESEARNAFLVRFADGVRGLVEPQAVAETACRLVAGELGVERAYWAEVDWATREYVVGTSVRAPGVPAVAGRFPVDAWEPLASLHRAGRPVVVADTGADPRIPPAVREGYARIAVGADLAVPVLAGGRLRCALAVNQRLPRRWTPQEVALVQGIAERCWSEVERARAEAALRAGEERQAFLLALSDAMRAEPTTEGLIGAAARLLGERLAASRVLFAELDEAKGVANVFNGWLADGAEPFPTAVRLKDYEGPILDDLRAGRTVRVEDARDGAPARPDLAAIAAVGVAALLSVPLVVGGRLVVNLSVHQHAARRWTDDEVALVREVAERLWADLVRARAEGALREREERLGAILETATDYAILTTDPEGRIETWSKGAEAVLGWAADEAVGRMMDVFFTPEDRAEGVPEQERRTAREQGQAPDVRWHLRRDGSRVFIDGATRPLAAPDGAPRGFVKVGQDVTERHRTEDALRDSEERLRAFGEASTDVLWVRDAATLQWEYLSPAFEAIYGMGVEEALAGDSFRNWLDLVVDEDRAEAVANIDRVRRGERVTFEYRVRRPADGEVRWLRNTDFPMRDEAGRVARFGGVGQDVTALKEAQAALAASEERLRVLMEGIPQLVWRSCEEGLWTWASPQWLDFTGQSQEQSHGRGWLDAIHPEDRERTMRAWEAARPHGRLDVEYRVRRASDGAWIWHRTRSVPVRDGEGRIVEWLGTSTDVQALKELQERQAVLVAELQHRTRNLVAVVRSTMDATLRGHPAVDQFAPVFRGRLAALGRVNGLLSRLGEDDRVAFDELIVAELSGLGAIDADGQGERVTLDGPRGVRLRSSTVQTFALALHELATNALKYGALGQPNGHLTVRWRRTGGMDGAAGERAGERSGERTGGPRLRVEWTETGVAMPEPGAGPQGGGYGRELIERALPYQLKAETRYELGPDGVRCTITLPLSSSMDGGGPVEEDIHA